MKNFSKKRGFTLIELLVVIAIIGILSSVVLVSLQSSRAKARDAKRIADISSLQSALALYFDSNSSYPDKICDTTDTKSLEHSGLISSCPKDPTTNSGYLYALGDGSLSYHLGTTLEQVTPGTGVLANKKGCSSLPAAPTCPGFTSGGMPTQASPSAGFDGTPGEVYDVTP